jgi:phosphoribosylformimino-5-aminoimidazole carboxamide ribotide isomerase
VLRGWFELSIEVIPAVDVLGTDAVRLRRGSYDEIVARGGDPVELAAAFAEAGASRVHLVDLDGARTGSTRPEVVRRIAAAAAPARLQASGGIRTVDDAQALLDAGADRVVVGTAAFPDPGPYAAALGEQLIVAVDTRDGRLRTAGWTDDGGLTFAEAVDRCVAAGVRRVLCTAIGRDGTLLGPDLDLVAAAAESGLLVLAAGGISAPADVEKVAQAGAEAAVVGRALLVALRG